MQKCAFCWCLLYRYITMHGSGNVKHDLITLKVTGEDYKVGRTEVRSVFEIATTFRILCSKHTASH